MSASSRSFPVFLSCLLAPAGVAFGADAPGSSDELERVLVSANRIEQPLSRVGDSVTLIDAEQVRGVLAAIAPIVGTARVASATGKIVRALGVAIEAAELEEEDEQ